MVKDITLGDLGDLDIVNGDFSVKDSDQQHVILIINTFVGNWKQYPLLGVGILNYLASSGKTQELKRNIGLQLESDGYKVNEIILTQSGEYYNYSIDANRI